MQAPSPRRLAGAALGAAAIVAIVWAISRSDSGPRTHDLVAPVRVAKIARRDFQIREHAVATILANSTVQVTARVQGTLTRVAFREGQFVKTGDLLFEIDPAPYQAALAQAKAVLARDEALLRNATMDRERYDQLFKVQAASLQQRDTATTNADALAGTVAADKATVQIAALNLGYTRILAPINGKTGPVLVHAGNVVSNTGTTPLVTIDQIQPVMISLNLPQQDLQQLHEGAQVKALTVTLDQRDTQGKAISANVDFIANKVDPESGTVELRATFPNPDFSLLPGQSLDAALVMHTIKNAFVVPADAVNQGPNGSYLYIVEDGRAVMHAVRVVAADEKSVAVSGNIAADEAVIAEGQLRVVPGGKVQVQAPADATSGEPAKPEMIRARRGH